MQALRVTIAIFVCAVQSVFAVIRHPEHQESEYREFGKQFPCVVNFAPQGGGGVVIAPTWILTAAHCVEGYASDAGTMFVLIDGVKHSVKRIILYPRYERGFLHNDIALVQLDGPLTLITPLPIYVGTAELGLPCIFVGYGWGFPFGFDFKFQPELVPENEWPNIRRAGTNQVSRVTDETLHTTADLTGNVTKLEYHTAGGDSGGPLIIEIDGKPYVAGILSGLTTDDLAESDFSRVSAYSRWIEDSTGEPFAVSRPERVWAWASLLIGLLCIAGIIRLRRHRQPTRRKDTRPEE